MTEKIKSAMEELEFDMECGEFYYPSMADSVKLAIRSLKAWEEVLTELEILIRGCDIMLEDTGEDIQSVLFYGGKRRAYESAIELINQKLEQIEEK